MSQNFLANPVIMASPLSVILITIESSSVRLKCVTLESSFIPQSYVLPKQKTLLNFLWITGWIFISPVMPDSITIFVIIIDNIPSDYGNYWTFFLYSSQRTWNLFCVEICVRHFSGKLHTWHLINFSFQEGIKFSKTKLQMWSYFDWVK